MSVEPMVKADIGGLSIKRDGKCMILCFSRITYQFLPFVPDDDIVNTRS